MSVKERPTPPESSSPFLCNYYILDRDTGYGQELLSQGLLQLSLLGTIYLSAFDFIFNTSKILLLLFCVLFSSLSHKDYRYHAKNGSCLLCNRKAPETRLLLTVLQTNRLAPDPLRCPFSEVPGIMFNS